MAIHKIAVIRFSSIGDIVLTFPTLHALKEKYPNAQITYVTKAVFAELVENDPAVHSMILLNKETRLSTIRTEIAHQKFDLIVDLHDNLRSRYLTLGMKSSVVRYRKGRVRRFAYLWFKKREMVVPVWQRYLKSLFDNSVKPDFTVHLPAGCSSLEHRIPEKPFLTVSPGSTWATKEWPIEKYNDLAKLLMPCNFPVVIIGGGKDVAVQEVFQSVLGKRVVPLAGELTITESAYVVSRSSMMLTVDTGMMHIGSAFDIPSVVMFGSTVREFGFFPFSSNAIVLERDLNCRPCSHTGKKECPQKHHRCMNEISPELVVRHIRNHFEEGKDA